MPTEVLFSTPEVSRKIGKRIEVEGGIYLFRESSILWYPDERTGDTSICTPSRAESKSASFRKSCFLHPKISRLPQFRERQGFLIRDRPRLRAETSLLSDRGLLPIHRSDRVSIRRRLCLREPERLIIETPAPPRPAFPLTGESHPGIIRAHPLRKEPVMKIRHSCRRFRGRPHPRRGRPGALARPRTRRNPTTTSSSETARSMTARSILPPGSTSPSRATRSSRSLRPSPEPRPGRSTPPG